MGVLAKHDIRHLDQAPAKVTVRQDETFGMFVDREITQVMANAFEHSRPPLNAFNLFPMANMGENTIRWSQQIKETITDAKPVDDWGMVGPEVDAAYADNERSVIHLTNHYKFSFKDMQMAANGTKRVDQEKGQSAREGHENTTNQVMFHGIPELGIFGAMNHPETLKFGFADSISFSNSVSTNLQLASSFFDVIDYATEGSSRLTQVAFPTKTYNVLTRQTLSGTSITLLQHLIQNTDGLRSQNDIMKVSELDGAAANNTDGALAFRQAESVVRMVNPIQFRQLPPERKGLQTKVQTISTVGGLEINKPQEFVVAEGL